MQAVSDSRSNANDQIAHAVRVLGRSRQRAAVFAAVYYGAKKHKTPEEIASRTRLPRKRVLEEAAKLANQHIIIKARVDGEVVYDRDSFYGANKTKILSLAANPAALRALPTKTNPLGGGGPTIRVVLPRRLVKIKQITVDDIDSFTKVRKISDAADVDPPSESEFKKGIQSIIGELGKFTDWGGERNDLFTTRIVLRGKRRPTAFAFKGPGTSGKLTPGKMGKNGDQIQRLFLGPSEVFILQYWGQVDESVLDQKKLLAIATSFKEDRLLYFGIIDGEDSGRLVRAYPSRFKRK
jgi:hypothetical protein